MSDVYEHVDDALFYLILIPNETKKAPIFVILYRSGGTAPLKRSSFGHTYNTQHFTSVNLNVKFSLFSKATDPFSRGMLPPSNAVKFI